MQMFKPNINLKTHLTDIFVLTFVAFTPFKRKTPQEISTE